MDSIRELCRSLSGAYSETELGGGDPFPLSHTIRHRHARQVRLQIGRRHRATQHAPFASQVVQLTGAQPREGWTRHLRHVNILSFLYIYMAAATTHGI
jgi:hypothetical protein